MNKIVCGKNAVREAIVSSRVNKLYLQAFNDEFINLAKKYSIDYQIIGKDKMEQMTTENHQGIIALVKDYQYYNLEQIMNTNKHSLIVILDGLKDPHNLGAIIRTCEATKVDGVIIPKNRSVRINETVSKVSTGAIEYVKVCEVTNISQTIDKLKKNGYWIVGAEHEARSQNYWDLNYDMPIALVIGSEGEGISRLIKEKCDFLIDIPMEGQINSLNASVSTAIIIYEIKRQQR